MTTLTTTSTDYFDRAPPSTHYTADTQSIHKNHGRVTTAKHKSPMQQKRQSLNM